MISIQNCSYHTHTNFSDGNNSLEEMVAKAKEIGFAELGISDHLIVHKNMAQSLSWPYWRQRGKYHIFKDNFKSILSDYQKHCEEIRKLSKKENFKLYVGFEVDFFTYDGWLEELKDFLNKFGIEIDNPEEIICLDVEDDIINYEVFYPIKGRVVSDEEKNIELAECNIRVVPLEQGPNTQMTDPGFYFDILNVRLPWIIK